MSKRQKMLKQLKTAARRRSRRPDAIGPAKAAESPKTLLMDQFAQTVLEFAEAHYEINNKQIISCFASTIGGTQCSDPIARDLQNAIRDCRKDELTDKAWRESLSAFLKEVEQIDRGSEDPRSFISYLHLMAS